jgi:Fe-S cluster biogenesis protein NfuA
MDAPQSSHQTTDSTPSSLAARVQAVLDSIRPALQMDGGDCDLVGVSPEGVVTVHMKGACGGCPSSSMTLTMGIEKRIKAKVPEIQKVVAV